MSAYERRQEKDLEWTLFCPTLILDEAADGNYSYTKNVLPTPITKLQVKAGNVAQFVVAELIERKFVNARVGINDK